MFTFTTLVTRHRRLLIASAIVLAIVVAAAAIPAVRHGALRRVGQYLTDCDQPAAADLIAMDVESGFAGALKIGDLHRDQPRAVVALLERRQTSLDMALKDRRIVVPDVMVDVLEQLGIPRHAIAQIPAGDGGTTETAAALAAWSRANPSARVLVVVGPSHGRRYRRALLRAWPDGRPAPRVVTTQYALFRGDDWWVSRTTLREGLVEIEKLALDYIAHPFR
jgi:hypothetical protein